MPTAKLSGLVTRLGRGSDAIEATDAELLGRFAATRDDAAFAELVRRHGRLVYGVCRRVTGGHHLAEDAFQAVFVVLAAKAAAIRPPAAVAAFLHGVACRTALRARTMSDRRRRREAPVGVLPDAPSPEPPEVHDAVALLDEEIARLSDQQRQAVVLCELGGVSRKDAAKRLGVAEGTLSSRLAAARKALADRLRSRGVALSAALAAAGGTSPPPALAAKAAAAATPVPVPAAVAALSHGVLRMLLLDKLKTAVPLAVAAGVLACAAFAAGPPVPPGPPAPKAVPLTLVAPAFPAQAKADAKPLPQGPNKLLFWRKGNLALIDPDGKNEKDLPRAGELHPSGAQLSPDGKSLAIPVPDPLPPDAGTPGARLRTATLHVRGIEEKGPGTSLGVACMTCVWSPDGTEIACSQFVDGPNQNPDVTNYVVNVKTKEKAAVKLPPGHIITDWSRDGKHFLTTSVDGSATQEKFRTAKLHLMNRDGTEHKALTDGKTPALFGRLSPDGTRVLFMEVVFKEETPAEIKARQEVGRAAPRPTHKMGVLDVATGKVAPIEDLPLNAEVQGYCWSPDGKKIAFTWREVHEGKPEDVRDRETESHLVVCDPDGKNAKTIASEKGQGPWHVTLSGVDWR